ncbi:MAG: hypothetical protein AYK18_18085 [Theionarchaea archaeon DG-70]|nr:MAG: hypothetical protein AYK18_18085 [Theionarchaea archaeon DG-70]MBU7030336.1 hypothetical protein [Theionarchaea archaeon]
MEEPTYEEKLEEVLDLMSKFDSFKLLGFIVERQRCTRKELMIFIKSHPPIIEELKEYGLIEGEIGITKKGKEFIEEFNRKMEKK